MCNVHCFNIFQSTPSAWRETCIHHDIGRESEFQSTPSAWRETYIECHIFSSMEYISIHSLRMEGDKRTVIIQHFVFISIHSLRMEGDLLNHLFTLQGLIFQSTPSAWRETFPPSAIFTAPYYFNPLPPHGGRPTPSAMRYCSKKISIHSLRMEGDRRAVRLLTTENYFNPLPPHGGRQL